MMCRVAFYNEIVNMLSVCMRARSEQYCLHNFPPAIGLKEEIRIENPDPDRELKSILVVIANFFFQAYGRGKTI